jgi:DNA-binding HxlR family transcriptional regulator
MIETNRPNPSVFLRQCPSRELLSRIADKWSVMIIVALAEQPLRFGSLKRKLDGVSQKMLTQTLRNLERDGLIVRLVNTGRPLKVEYRLSVLGDTLIALLQPLLQWAEQNLATVALSQVDFDSELASRKLIDLAKS